MNSKKILYISYDGMCEPLGQSQVLAYVSQLAGQWDFEILSFEKPEDLANAAKMDEIRNICAAKSIVWTPFKYHRSPSLLATSYDILMAWFYFLKLLRKNRPAIVHCRSYVATMMGLPIRLIFKTPLIFDMRGFWADEKVDSGSWKKGWLYSLVKKLERFFLKKANHIISLTHMAVHELSFVPDNKFSVIPTCVALEKFKLNASPPEQFVMGYVGGTQLWYDFPRTLGLFNAILTQLPDAKLHIINKGEHDYVLQALAFAEVPMENVILEERSHGQISKAYERFSVGMFFIKDLYSKKASMPTKLGEFMASGVPVVTGKGIGDVDYMINEYQCGILLDLDYGEEELAKVLWLAKDLEVRKRCRQLAEKEFSLGKGINQIDGIYRQLSSAVPKQN